MGLRGCGRRRAAPTCRDRAGGRCPDARGRRRRRAGRRAPRRATAPGCRALRCTSRPAGLSMTARCSSLQATSGRSSSLTRIPRRFRPARRSPAARNPARRRTRTSRSRITTPRVISTSARLNAGHGPMSTKSVTAPSWIRSIRFPTAPPASRPIGSQRPRRSDAARKTAEQARESDRGEDEDERPRVVEEAERDAAVRDPDEIDAGQEVDPLAGLDVAADERLRQLVERECDERDQRGATVSRPALHPLISPTTTARRTNSSIRPIIGLRSIDMPPAPIGGTTRRRPFRQRRRRLLDEPGHGPERPVVAEATRGTFMVPGDRDGGDHEDDQDEEQRVDVLGDVVAVDRDRRGRHRAPAIRSQRGVDGGLEGVVDIALGELVESGLGAAAGRGDRPLHRPGIVREQVLAGAGGRLADEPRAQFRVEPGLDAGLDQGLDGERDVSRRAAHHGGRRIELVLGDLEDAAERSEQRERLAEDAAAGLVGERRVADDPVADLDARGWASSAGPASAPAPSRSRASGVAPSTEITPPARPAIRGATASRAAGLTASTTRSARSAMSSTESSRSPADLVGERLGAARARVGEQHPSRGAATRAPIPGPPRRPCFPILRNRRSSVPRLDQDWLKKPFSTRRAFSSAETSTLAGVSMKVLSAIFCMPPSSA